MRRVLLVAVAMATMVFGLAAPAGANFSNGPSSPGNVERFDDPGYLVVADFEQGLLVFANVNSIADACNDNPAGPGDAQIVILPDGRVKSLLHDDDVPVIVAPLAPPDVVCPNAAEWPVIATGSGDVRSSSNGKAFGIRVNGSVEDANGDLWSIQASIRGNNTRFQERVNLVKRG